jgi:hypothetical protein
VIVENWILDNRKIELSVETPAAGTTAVESDRAYRPDPRQTQSIGSHRAQQLCYQALSLEIEK